MSFAKHIINKPETLAFESLFGQCYIQPELKLLKDEKVIFPSDIQKIAENQVTIVSGGGSGHEPGYSGMVGKGGLAANVCGHIFASPSSSQVLAAIEHVKSPHGTLVILMNYTGDCLNFGLAVERAKAKGIKVDMIVVGDDVSIGRAKNEKVGRRGLAATALAIKLAGALAEKGGSLEQVRQIVEHTIRLSATVGIALDHCHVPETQSVTQLKEDELEVGMGIHNESGVSKTKLKTAHETVSTMMHLLTDQDDPDRSYLKLEKGTPVVILVNNLGGMPSIELNLAVKETVEYALRLQLVPVRVYSGAFVTSLNMPGFSITLFAVKDDSVLDLLDHQVNLIGWPSTAARSFSKDIIEDRLKTDNFLSSKSPQLTDPKILKAAIKGAAHAIIKAEPDITHYDTILGDGDCGQTLKTAALAILDGIDSYPLECTSNTIILIADTIESSVGGTSSALYCIFLNALAAGLNTNSESDAPWAYASQHALESLMTYTKARAGDRTLMDALCPFVKALETSSILEAAEKAQAGADSTRTLPSHLGRSSYLSDKQVLDSNMPDPGAYGLSKLLTGMAEALK